MTKRHSPWGHTADGEPFFKYSLENSSIRAKFTNMGAAIVRLEVADRRGKFQNVTVSCPSPEGYVTNSTYLGATVGRYANRIAKGQFWLEGKSYTLAVNNGPNHLHGGIVGFSQRLWKAQTDENQVLFQYESPDGEEGYPGTVQVSVTYRLEGNSLVLEYSARSNAATVINLTNHAYWNLSGHGSILDHQLQLFAERYLENDSNTLPTGNILEVVSSPFDFRQPRRIGEAIDQTGIGYDNCFVIDRWDGTLRPAARVVDPKSGRVMEVLTTEPGIQLYTANYFDGTDRSGGFQKHEAFCLECQRFPDSPNQAEFPSTALRPGQEYRQTTVHRFSVLEADA